MILLDMTTDHPIRGGELAQGAAGSIVHLVADLVEVFNLWPLRSAPFGKYCRRSPFMFSLLGRCHGLALSQKNTGRPVRLVSISWSASSVPWSQVNDRRRSAGNRSIVAARAAVTASADFEADGPERLGGCSGRPVCRGPTGRSSP
jgi:hypothetical protein